LQLYYKHYIYGASRDCRILWKIPGILRIIICVHYPIDELILGIGIVYTKLLTCPHRKKSRHIKSSKRTIVN